MDASPKTASDGTQIHYLTKSPSYHLKNEREIVLTSSQISVLNAARTVLKELSEYSHLSDIDEVRSATMANVAGDAIFDYINTANAFLNLSLSYEQLHNSPEPNYIREEE